MADYGDYVFYADESGDHHLSKIDPDFPVFVLSMCAFRKVSYCNAIVPKFQKLKFQFFGHDSVILHERDIRKQEKDFRIFAHDRLLRTKFLEAISQAIEHSRFHTFPVGIEKGTYAYDMFPENPYHACLRYVLFSAYQFLAERGQAERITHFVFERRGHQEDQLLEAEFYKIIAGAYPPIPAMPGFRIIMSDKKSNATGMQIADLMARPYALGFMRPHQPNQALAIGKRKIWSRHSLRGNPTGVFIPR